MSRQRLYLVMMGTCVGMFVVAWLVVSRFSVTAAVVVSVAAAMLPPVAAIVANSRRGR